MDEHEAHAANTAFPKIESQPTAAVFDDIDSAGTAIAELRQNGFDPHKIGMAFPDDSGSRFGRSNPAEKRGAFIAGFPTAALPGWTMGMAPLVFDGVGPTVVLGSLALAQGPGGPDDLRGFAKRLGLGDDAYGMLQARLSRGGILVAIDAEGKVAIARNILERNGGHSLRQSKL